MNFPFDWQTALALAIVAAALWRLAYVYVSEWRGSAKSGCGSCPNASTGAKTKQLISISKVATRDSVDGNRK